MIIVAVAICLYLIYLLRKPIGWVIASIFLAVALAGPVNSLSERMRRGLAISIVYVGLLLIPIALGALIVPPVVTQGNELAQNAPEYARDVSTFVQDNERLRQLNDDYDITTRLEDEAAKLPGRLGGAAKTLGDIGVGIVNSVFALVTILVLTAFLLGSGRHWVEAFLRLQPPDRARRLRRVLTRSASAVSGYVSGALLIATVAGVLSYVVMLILGVPFRGPLAVVVGFFSLIPLIGATIAAVIVGLVTLFVNFPTATIAWTVYAILYQQLENHLIQPQVQKRTVNVHPFITVVAVLFGSALLGVTGAIIAIPVAAIIQIAIREWWSWSHGQDDPDGSEPPGMGERGDLEHDLSKAVQGEDEPPPAASGPEPSPA